MLWNGRQTLIKQKFETVVVSANQEGAPPQIRAPVAHSLHQADELAFVGGELEVASCKWPAEVGEESRALVEDGSEPRARCIAVDHERRVEIRHLKHGPRRQGALECLESRRRVVVPHERVSPQETRERGRDDAEVADELPVVSCQAQEAAKAPGRAR